MSLDHLLASMGLRAPKLSNIVQTGPPEVSPFTLDNFRRYKGTGDPSGRVPGAIGDEYLDLNTGATWNKLADDGFKTGWSPASAVALQGDGPPDGIISDALLLHWDRVNKVLSINDDDGWRTLIA